MSVPPNFIEEWKGVIDFAKTVLSISTTLLAAIASLLLVGNYKLQGLGWMTPALLILATGLSLWGFGRAIAALRNGTAKNASVLLCNLSVVALIVAIVGAPFTMQIEAGSTSMDQVLNTVEASTKKWPVDLSARNCTSITRKGDEVVLIYKTDSHTVQVIYSIAMKNILQID